METKTKFIKPINVTEFDLVFGGNIDDLMPNQFDIPDEFKNYNSKNKWVSLTEKWFFSGLSGAKFIPKKDIDPDQAIRHIAAILRSYEPSHEDKISSCAYLMSEFFEDVILPGGINK
jgi:hypothetical protein